MVCKMYRIKCLTNMHMGGNGIGYSIVDLEVERDPVTNEPTMNATGVKGALRDWFGKQPGVKEEDVDYAFGKPGKETTQGACKFFAGDLLARPVPVTKGSALYALGTTEALLELFFKKAKQLKATSFELPKLQGNTGNKLWCGSQNIESVNNYVTYTDGVQNPGNNDLAMKSYRQIFEDSNWVLLKPDQLIEHPLAVQAHNVLKDGKSNNLWYEEVVPHESIFGLLIGYPDDEKDTGAALLMKKMSENPVVQFGAGASTGEGFTQITEFNLGGKA